MKNIILVLLAIGLTSCSSFSMLGVRRHENDYIYTTNPPAKPVSKIPPGSLLSQQVSH